MKHEESSSFTPTLRASSGDAPASGPWGVPRGVDKHVEEQIAKLKKELAPEKAENKKKPVPIIWRGTLRKFGDLMTHLFRNGYIQAKNDHDAIKQGCKHFQLASGKIKPENVIESLRIRETREGKDPSPPVPSSLQKRRS